MGFATFKLLAMVHGVPEILTLINNNNYLDQFARKNCRCSLDLNVAP